ncbi:MAG: hypothetical protein M1420_04855 [Actinobacteria bacterium]|nr:hypothetical protein [Actinomycetota bacterium]
MPAKEGRGRLLVPAKVVSIKRQCESLKPSRSGFHYQKTQIPDECLDLMEDMDRLHTDFPFMDSRQSTRVLQCKGFCAQRPDTEANEQDGDCSPPARSTYFEETPLGAFRIRW